MINQHFLAIVENHIEKGVGDLVGNAFKPGNSLYKTTNFGEYILFSWKSHMPLKYSLCSFSKNILTLHT
jgi:hypothetical protein